MKIKSLVIGLSLFAGMASAATLGEKVGDRGTEVASIKRDLANSLSHQGPVLHRQLREKFNINDLTISQSELSGIAPSAGFKMQLQRSDNQMLRAKGISKQTSQVMELRLAKEEMLPALKSGEEILFAYEPQGDESEWTHIEAFDQQGNTILLDVNEVPNQPVIVIDIDNNKTMQAGVKAMREVFQAGDIKLPATASSVNLESEGLAVTQMSNIRLDDDKEPWISGKAEIYAVVNGIDPERKEPELDVIDMPYLDHDSTTYYPGQVMFIWDRYRFAAADVILMEQDDGTNYQDLATSLLAVATEALNLFGQPDIAAIVNITGRLIAAMPSSWFVNDDDFVDVFYTIMKDKEYINHKGASGNATITFKPLVIPAN